MISHLRNRSRAGQGFRPGTIFRAWFALILRFPPGRLDDDRLDAARLHAGPRVVVFTLAILSTTSMPSMTLPKTA